jgi:protein-disulfide isomerase
VNVRRVTCILLAALMLSFAPAFGQEGTNNEIIGVINGEKVTMADLEKEQGNKLLQVQYQIYLAEQKALDDLIDDRLLQMEAKRQNITLEALLDKEVNKKVVDPSEDQLQIYYDDLNAKESYAALRDKILERIRQRRIAKARDAYIQALRAKADILVTLAPPAADFSIGNAPRLGPAEAPVRLVEFADYECPYCARMNPQIKKLREEFGDKLSLYFKDLPLPMHAQAQKAAEAAHCAGQQDKYWQYHDLLFSNGGLGIAQLKQYARDLKLDPNKFDTCLDSGAETAAVQSDYREAQKLGLTGTPSFFLNGRFFSGAVEYNTLRDLVQQQLSMSKLSAQVTGK